MKDKMGKERRKVTTTLSIWWRWGILSVPSARYSSFRAWSLWENARWVLVHRCWLRCGQSLSPFCGGSVVLKIMHSGVILNLAEKMWLCPLVAIARGQVPSASLNQMSVSVKWGWKQYSARRDCSWAAMRWGLPVPSRRLKWAWLVEETHTKSLTACKGNQSHWITMLPSDYSV